MKKDVALLWEQANIAIQQGKLSTAENCLSKLLQTIPDHIDAWRLQGIIAAKQGNFATATDHFQQAIEYDPNNAVLYNDLGLSLARQQRYTEAEKMYLCALDKQQHYAEALNNLASVYYKQGNFNQAQSCCKKALDIDPDYLAAHYNLGLTYTQLGQFNDAIEQFNIVLTLSPTHGHAHFHLANLLVETGQLDVAQQHYQAAIENQPALVNAYTNLAAIHLKQSQLNNAKACYQAALNLDPNTPDVHFNMGVILAEQGNLPDAIKHYQSVLEQQPHYIDAWQNMAVCYYQQGNTAMAITCYENALKISPDNPTLTYLLSAIKQDNAQQSAPIAYVKQLFNNYAGNYDQHLQNILCYQVPTQLTKLIEETCRPTANAWEVLDLGCGTGLMGSAIKPYANDILGIDIANDMLEKAKSKTVYDQLICADVKTFVMQCDQQFDLITAADVFGYIGNLERLFLALINLLKPSGLLAFSIEITQENTLQLQPTGRFQHSVHSIQQLAKQHQLTVIAEKIETIRLQQRLPVAGALFLLAKNCVQG